MEFTQLRVGIQGGRGSFNEQACFLYVEDHHLSTPTLEYLYTTLKVLQHLNQGSLDFGIFAVTNNLSGIILESLEAMAQYNFQLLDIFDMPVHYFLMARPGVGIDEIEVIMSHPTVLEGCRQRLKQKFSTKKLSSGEGILIDQAAAAAYLAESGSPKSVAVIAPLICAEIYGLRILAENLEDDESFTTFVWCKKR